MNHFITSREDLEVVHMAIHLIFFCCNEVICKIWAFLQLTP